MCLLGASCACHAHDDGAVPAGVCQACRRECQDAAELGAGQTAAIGACCGVAHGPGVGSEGGVEGVAVKSPMKHLHPYLLCIEIEGA
jgi:hypothetical protein